MSEMLAKMADSTARQYEKRAASTTDPTKRQKLLDKAAKSRQEAAEMRRPKAAAPAPQTGPGRDVGRLPEAAPARVHPMDAPTQRLRHVPSVPGRPPREGLAPGAGQVPAPVAQAVPAAPMSSLKKVGIGVVSVFAFIGLVTVFGGGGDDGGSTDGDDAAVAAPAVVDAPVEQEAAVAVDPADVAACVRAGEVRGACASAAQGRGTGEVGLPEFATATRTAMNGMSEVPILANDERVHDAGRALTAQYEMIAAAATRGDLPTLSELASEGTGIVREVVSACSAAVGEDLAVD